MGHDFGFNHANAVLKVGIKDGELYVFKESYLFEKDTGEIIEELNAEGWDKKQLMYCDSANLIAFGCFVRKGSMLTPSSRCRKRKEIKSTG